VPFNQSQLLVAALEAAGTSVKFHSVEGGGHGQCFGADGACGLYADPEVQPTVTAFFATHLKADRSHLLTLDHRAACRRP
jgi:hypothetical protein